MQKYQYPDFNDVLMMKFLEEFEKNENYWDVSEKRVIGFMLDFINRKAGFRFANFLDAGCGKGRLFNVFQKYFSKITAIEPDKKRFLESLKEVEKLGMKDKTTVINITAEEFKSDKRFDFILNSHVLQHIPTDCVLPLISNLKDHLNENGVIAVTTCHSTKSKDHFVYNYVEKGKPVVKEIDKEEFNSFVDSKFMLPIHYFDPALLIKDFERIGLKTSLYKVFHVSKEDRDLLKQQNVDEYVNSSKELQSQYGIDMCLLLEKV